MCGLVGIAGDCTMRTKDIFTDLLYIDTLRGAHSTGAAILKRDKDEIMMVKEPIPGPEFIQTDAFKKLMAESGVKVMLGHNRYATIGEKTSSNAHPFEFEHITGAHNGTLDKISINNLDDSHKFGTDSEALYHNINIHGLKATIGKMTGAWALTFIDKQTNTINLLRNDKRPLYYAYSSDMQTLFWASEAEMLQWLLTRHNLKLADDKIYSCVPDMHYRWQLPAYLGLKFEKPVVTKVEGYKYVYVPKNNTSTTYYHGSGYKANREMWQDGYDEEPWDYSVKTPKLTTTVTSDPNAEIVVTVIDRPKDRRRTKTNGAKFRQPYKDAYGRVINKTNFTDLVAEGCVYCDVGGQEWGTFIHPLKDDVDGRKLYLCEECYENDEILELIEQAL